MVATIHAANNAPNAISAIPSAHSCGRLRNFAGADTAPVAVAPDWGALAGGGGTLETAASVMPPPRSRDGRKGKHEEDSPRHSLEHGTEMARPE
jgi:hypothetical protein